LDGIVDVSVDPETLVPQPKALRQWMLDNAVDRKLITPEQWRERSQFGDVRDMQAPSEIDYQKAMRVAQQILLGMPQEPVVWQDDEAIHQNVLERDILKAPPSRTVTPQVQQVAQQRWQQLAQQHQKKTAPPAVDPNSPEGQYQTFIQKITQQATAKAEQLIAQAIEEADLANARAAQQGAVPGAPQGPVPPAGPGGPPHAPEDPRILKGKPMDGRVAPTFGSTPSIASAPVSMQGGPGVSAQEQAGAVFDHRSLQ
jgi:hypothetical protein